MSNCRGISINRGNTLFERFKLDPLTDAPPMVATVAAHVQKQVAAGVRKQIAAEIHIEGES